MCDLNGNGSKSPKLFFGSLPIICKKIIAAVFAVFGNTDKGGFLNGFVSWPLSK